MTQPRARHIDSTAKSELGPPAAGSTTTHTVWSSSIGSGAVSNANSMSILRNTCCSESNARPASSLWVCACQCLSRARLGACLRLPHARYLDEVGPVLHHYFELAVPLFALP